MIKVASIFILVLSVSQAACSAPMAQVRLNSNSDNKIICNFSFAEVNGLIVAAKPISENSLKTRIDNERFDACPYKVEIRYQGVAINLDFGLDVTLKRIQSVAEEGAVRTAFFRYDENGWGEVSSDISFKKDDMVLYENEHSLALAAIVQRKIAKTKRTDFCFSLVIIGEDKFATGAVCRPSKNELLPIKLLFDKGPVILPSK